MQAEDQAGGTIIIRQRLADIGGAAILAMPDAIAAQMVMLAEVISQSKGGPQ